MDASNTPHPVEAIEAVLQPLGRCAECGGGWAYWKHGPGDPLLGHHEFQQPRPKERCTLWRNPLPLGWGDHVRWMHEDHVIERGAGPRHAKARRETAKMRERAWRRLCETVPRRFTAEDVYTGLGDDDTIRDIHARSQTFAPGYGQRQARARLAKGAH